MTKKTECDVYYFSDMQKCMKCGLCWDANYPHPPACNYGKIDSKPAGKIEKIIALFFGLKP